MPNETQIECYFKSSEIAALCKISKDIVIKFKASYPPGKPPVFEISAAGFTRGAKTRKTLIMADGGSSGGCPKPC